MFVPLNKEESDHHRVLPLPLPLPGQLSRDKPNSPLPRKRYSTDTRKS